MRKHSRLRHFITSRVPWWNTVGVAHFSHTHNGKFIRDRFRWDRWRIGCLAEMHKQICYRASVSHESQGCSGSGHAVHLNAAHKNRNSLKAVFSSLILCRFPLWQLINKKRRMPICFDGYYQMKRLFAAVCSRFYISVTSQQQPGGFQVSLVYVWLWTGVNKHSGHNSL